MDHVIVRSGQSGVWCGVLVSREGDTVKLDQARKIWRWRGANTTSDIARTGISKDYSRVAPPVDGAIILGVCEVLPATADAAASVAACGWPQ
jgi:hypothetical protein